MSNESSSEKYQLIKPCGPLPGTGQVVMSEGRRTMNLAGFVAVDGILDPLRSGLPLGASVVMSVKLILDVSPWCGPIDRDDYKARLISAITYGVSQGAEVTGQALAIARDAGLIEPQIVDPILDLAAASSMFGTLVGTKPSSVSTTDED